MSRGKAGAPWTEDEDALLAQYQAIYGNRWSLISSHIGGRNGQACAQRWRHKVNPSICKAKWTPEEDSQLVALVSELGVGKWATVARHLPGRTDQQCMGRWRRHLDPAISKDAWTEEEDALLQALHQELGTAWSAIAKRIAHRTPQQCRGRWCVLTGSGKGKQAAEPATRQQASVPETPLTGLPVSRSSRRTGAVAVAAAPATRGVCASSLSRRAVTELPAMPASVLAARPAEAAPPPTVQQTRGTRLSARLNTAALRCQAVVEQALEPTLREREAATESTESQSDTESTDEPDQVDASERTGRFVLGRRTVAFRTQPRTTRAKPRVRLAGVLATSPLDGATRLAAAVALLPPPPRQIAGGEGAADEEDEDTAAMLSVLLEDEDVGAASGDASAQLRGGSEGAAAAAAAAAGPGHERASAPCDSRSGESRADTTTASASTSTSLPRSDRSGRRQRGSRQSSREEGEGDAVTSSARKTRSGRCYQAAAGASMDRRLRRQVVTSAQTQELRDTATGGAPAPSPGADDAAVAAAAVAAPPTANVDAQPAAVGGLAGPTGAIHIHSAAAQAAAPAEGDVLAPQAEAPGGGAVVSPVLDAEQLADWLSAGSPPTSTLLALLQSGLLQTPSAAHSPSPGRSLLNAPIPPGMPKVTPGLSNEWSDVPAVSWSAWRNCNGGFGVAGHPPVASVHGTPDNSRPAVRASEDVRGIGVTPSRDMFVRPALHAVDGSGYAPHDAAFTAAAAAAFAAPGGGSSHRCSGSRRASIDEATLEREARLRLVLKENGVFSPGPRPGGPPGQSPGRQTPLLPDNGHVLPDFCSPSKKQRMASTSDPGDAGGLPGGLRRTPVTRAGSMPGPTRPTGLLNNLPCAALSGRDHEQLARSAPSAPMARTVEPPSAPPPAAQHLQHDLPPPPPPPPPAPTLAPKPPTLARALMPPPSSRGRLYGPSPAAAAIPLPAGALPRPSLAGDARKPMPPPMPTLPKLPLPLGLPKLGGIASLFPVLTLQGYQGAGAAEGGTA